VNRELCRDAIARFADNEFKESGINDSASEIFSMKHRKRIMMLLELFRNYVFFLENEEKKLKTFEQEANGIDRSTKESGVYS
jgi:hypothetical protein